MKTFILMTKLSPELMKNIQDRAEMGHAWLYHVKKRCPEVKFIAHYALLGGWDFMDIYEAPDDDTAAKISLISRENGAIEAQSMTAIPYKQYLDIVKSL